jgi:hypothetical protein
VRACHARQYRAAEPMRRCSARVKDSGPRSKDQRTPPVPTARGFSFLAIGSRCHRPGRCAEARTKSRQAGRSDIRFVIYGDIVQREDFWPATRKSRFESECLHQFAGVVQRLRIRPCHGRDAGSTPAVRSNTRRVDQWQIGSLIRIRSEVRSLPLRPVALRRGAATARLAHNQKVEGLSPSAATKTFAELV